MKRPSRNIHSSFDFTLSKRFQLHLSELKRCGWLAVQLTWAWCSHRAPLVSAGRGRHILFPYPQHPADTRSILWFLSGSRSPRADSCQNDNGHCHVVSSQLSARPHKYKSNLGNIIYLTVPWVWWARARRNRQKYLLKANLVTSRHTE